MTPQQKETLQQALMALKLDDTTTAEVLLAGVLGSTSERTETIYRVQRKTPGGKRAWGKDKRDYSRMNHVKQFMRCNKDAEWDVWVGSIIWTQMSPTEVEELI